MSIAQARRLSALERAAPLAQAVYLWRDADQTEAEVLAARFCAPTAPPGVRCVIISWSQPDHSAP